MGVITSTWPANNSEHNAVAIGKACNLPNDEVHVQQVLEADLDKVYEIKDRANGGFPEKAAQNFATRAAHSSGICRLGQP